MKFEGRANEGGVPPNAVSPSGQRKSTPLAPLILLSLVLGAGCNSKKGAEMPPVAKQGAADEILRISDVWRADLLLQGILSPPSPISTFKTIEQSELALGRDQGHETMTVEERLELRSGESVTCRTRVEHPLQVRFGRSRGEAAIEITRPEISAVRDCEGVHPEGRLEREPLRALFVLRADQLVALAPPLEKRQYLPSSR